MLQTEAGKPPVIVWESLRMKPKFTNFVVRGNRAWALDEGRLACLDLDTGKSLWRGSSYGHGQMLGAGAVLIVQSERGEVVLAAADDQEERVLARIPALSSKTWNQPCLAGTLLLVRNDREAVCFELAPAVP
jgi:outer membrane protein assembly factor BamB